MNKGGMFGGLGKKMMGDSPVFRRNARWRWRLPGMGGAYGMLGSGGPDNNDDGVAASD